jgi:hypothetical protein
MHPAAAGRRRHASAMRARHAPAMRPIRNPPSIRPPGRARARPACAAMAAGPPSRPNHYTAPRSPRSPAFIPAVRAARSQRRWGHVARGPRQRARPSGAQRARQCGLHALCTPCTPPLVPRPCAGASHAPVPRPPCVRSVSKIWVPPASLWAGQIRRAATPRRSARRREGVTARLPTAPPGPPAARVIDVWTRKRAHPAIEHAPAQPLIPSTPQTRPHHSPRRARPRIRPSTQSMGGPIGALTPAGARPAPPPPRCAPRAARARRRAAPPRRRCRAVAPPRPSPPPHGRPAPPHCRPGRLHPPRTHGAVIQGARAALRRFREHRQAVVAAPPQSPPPQQQQQQQQQQQEGQPLPPPGPTWRLRLDLPLPVASDIAARGARLEDAPFCLADEGDWPGGAIQRFRALRQVRPPCCPLRTGRRCSAGAQQRRAPSKHLNPPPTTPHAHTPQPPHLSPPPNPSWSSPSWRATTRRSWACWRRPRTAWGCGSCGTWCWRA